MKRVFYIVLTLVVFFLGRAASIQIIYR
jgi:hypothetical protein